MSATQAGTIYSKTILVVDDNEDDCILVERSFRSIGVTGPIHTLKGGHEAIRYLNGEGHYADRKKFAYPTFIITDLKMPDGDGFTVLEHLKLNPEWAIIPTIVMSASADADDVKTAYALGASSYHHKPGSLEKLKSQLKTLHDYWMTCQVPEVDATGKQLPTQSKGKLGERFRLVRVG
jgi:CheY-like chemotaxis protein